MSFATRLSAPTILATLAILFTPLLTPGAADALLYLRVADADLADQAAAVAEVRVTAVDPAPGIGRPVTDYTVAVERLISGELPGSAVTVRVPGGALADGRGFQIYGAPRFGEGERALLFLAPWGDGTFAVLHLFQGAFRLAEAAGSTVAYRTFEDAEEVEMPGRAALRPEAPRDLERFRGWLADRAAGVEREQDYFVEVPVPADGSSIREKFTTFVGNNGFPLRWREFETGAAVRWFAHPDGQPGLAGGGFSEFQTALRAWNNDPGTPIRLTYAGTNASTSGFDSFDDRNVILFDDPEGTTFDTAFSCAAGGTIAAGGPWWREGSFVHLWNGEMFNTIAGGDIVTNKGIECWVGRNRGGEEVFAHELGHALGLRHSCGDSASGPCNTSLKDEALMRANAHGDGRGARLNGDDRAGVAYLYTPNLTPPARPRDLTATAMGPGIVGLDWRDFSNNEASFEIERRRVGGDEEDVFELVAAVGANVSEYEDVEVSSGLGYAFRVRARNGAGTSGYSNEATATTPGELAPTELEASAISTSAIRLTWTDNASGESGYEIEGFAGELDDGGDGGGDDGGGDDGGDGGVGAFVLFDTVPAGSEMATLEGLEIGTPHTFRVRAIGGVGESSYTDAVTATTFLSEPVECVPGGDTLCLNGGRFQVRVDWRDFDGDTGVGSVVPVTGDVAVDDSGLFYFFFPQNWEMLVKVIDGCGFNGRFWVFAAATTSVEYTLEVTDTLTGFTQEYSNPLGTASAATADVEAFATCAAEPPPGTGNAVTPATGRGSEPLRQAADFFAALPAGASNGVADGSAVAKGHGCTAGDETLCLNGGRFQVEVEWTDFEGVSGPGQVVDFGSDDSGLFWFFREENWEMLVKVLDGCAFDGSYWVFAAATTNVGYTLTVTDTVNDETVEYANPVGTLAPAITDTGVFGGCP